MVKNINKVITNVFLVIGLIFLSGCAMFSPTYNYDYLEGNKGQSVIVSKHAPYSQFVCSSLGFLPCSYNSKNETVENNVAYMQCAQNVLQFAVKIDANYLHIEKPIQTLGIKWSDAKANLFRCQWLPLPQNN